MQSEHLGYFGRGVASHDICLYHIAESCQVPICETLAICVAFSVDFRVICGRPNSTDNPRRLNLAVFPIHVKGFVSGTSNANKHSLALTDLQICEISCKPLSNNVSPNLFNTLRDEGNQQEPSSSATSLSCSASALQPRILIGLIPYYPESLDRNQRLQ